MPSPTLQSLILPEGTARELRDIVLRARSPQRPNPLVAASSVPRGTCVLFSGPSGTGKTFAATALSQELGRPVLRVDLSGVVSKYIGETEKHLDRIFDDAVRTGSVLVFEEADALFGRRTEVKDSHDRDANVDTDYLLQRLESFPGLVILTTRLRSNIDPDLLRRLARTVEFPPPGPPEREQLWRAALPAGTQSGIDYARLAELPLTGGQIERAASQVTRHSSPVSTETLLAAAVTERKDPP